MEKNSVEPKYKAGQVLVHKTNPHRGGIKIMYQYPIKTNKRRANPLYKVKYLGRQIFEYQNQCQSTLEEFYIPLQQEEEGLT